MKKLAAIAKAKGLEFREEEGGRHSKVWIGTTMQPVPRHTEINEITARRIIRRMEEG